MSNNNIKNAKDNFVKLVHQSFLMINGDFNDNDKAIIISEILKKKKDSISIPMKEVLETKAPNKNENKITPNGQQNILVPVENNEQVEPLPEVEIKTINVKTDSKEKVFPQRGKGGVFRQNGNVLRIGDWYYDTQDQTYYRWDENSAIFGDTNEYGLPETPIRIEKPPKGHPAWNGDD
jgi:hypothetical protein